MRFLRPEYAQWFLVLPLLVAAWIVHRGLRAAFRRRARIAPRFAALSRRTTWGRDLLVVAIAIVAASATVLALMRPQMSITRTEPQYAQLDLVVMLDRSVSMRARDIVPSRAARAVTELRNLVRQKPPGLGRIALVGFSDSAVVLSYLTDDSSSLLFYFDWIAQDETVFLGTDISAALRSALAVVQRDRRESDKALLLVSDGEDQSGKLNDAIKEVVARRLRVDCVGIGSDDAVPIPLPPVNGKRDYLRDDGGRPLATRFSEQTLRTVAAATGGTYLRSRTGKEVGTAFNQILEGERRLVGRRESTEYRDLYLFVLGAAAAAATGLWILT